MPSRPSLHTRREVVVAGGVVAAAAALVPDAWGRLTAREARVGPGLFLDGVASGEPAPDAMTFWGRLTTSVPRSGARLVVCEDEGLTRTVATTVVPTSRGIDHCLKVRVTGLAPSRFYYYAWQSGDSVSEVGRTKTAPPADSDVPLNLAYSSCQRYPAGFFNGHTEAAGRELDLYVFLGDYTYEYGPTGADADDSPTKPRTDPGASVDLASYRDKLKLYRSDAGLRELHRLHPVVHIWDDHEVADNYSDNNPAPSPLQRTAGYRASFEWLPRMVFPEDRFRIYKTVKLGTMAELFLLDQRQYRRGDNDGSPVKTILGRAQLDWFKAALEASTARWKLVGNEVQLTPLIVGGRPINPDQWDGYPTDRQEVLDTVAQVNAADARYGGNVVFLTGDIHTFEANQVLRQATSGPPIATEFVGGSIGSAGLSDQSGAVEASIKASNPWIKQFNGNVHGYAALDLDGRQATVDYRVSDITVRGAPSRSLTRYVQSVGANNFATAPGSRIVDGELPRAPTDYSPRAAPTAQLAARRRTYAAAEQRHARRLERARSAARSRRGR